MHKIDVEHTQARLAQYEALNKTHIAQQQQQREQESARQQQVDEAARQERLLRAQKIKEEQALEQKEREAEEKAIMAELEKGRNIDEVMAEREKRRKERQAASQQRASEEQHRQRLFEAHLQEPAPTSRAKLSAAELEYAHKETGSDFSGPFATIDDGAAFVEARPAPASMGGLGASGAIGYVDPWLRSEYMSKTAVAQYRAGGYDWQNQVWMRGLLTLSDGLLLRPIP